MPNRKNKAAVNLLKAALLNTSYLRVPSTDSEHYIAANMKQTPNTWSERDDHVSRLIKSPNPLSAAVAPEKGTLKRPYREIPQPKDEEPMLSQLLKRFRQCTTGNPIDIAAPTLIELKTTYGKASKKDIFTIIILCSQWICKGADYAIRKQEELKMAQALLDRWSGYNIQLTEAPVADEFLEDARAILAGAFADIEMFFEQGSDEQDGVPTFKSNAVRMLDANTQEGESPYHNLARSKLEHRLQQCVDAGPDHVPAPTLNDLETTYADASEADLNFMVQRCAKGICTVMNNVSSPRTLYRMWTESIEATDKRLKDTLRKVLAEAFEQIQTYMEELMAENAEPEDTDR